MNDIMPEHKKSPFKKWGCLVTCIIALFLAFVVVRGCAFHLAKYKDFGRIISDSCIGIGESLVRYAKDNNGKLPAPGELKAALVPKYCRDIDLQYEHDGKMLDYKAVPILIGKKKGLLVYFPARHMYWHPNAKKSGLWPSYRFYPGCLIWEGNLSSTIVALDEIPNGVVTTMEGINTVLSN